MRAVIIGRQETAPHHWMPAGELLRYQLFLHDIGGSVWTTLDVGPERAGARHAIDVGVPVVPIMPSENDGRVYDFLEAAGFRWDDLEEPIELGWPQDDEKAAFWNAAKYMVDGSSLVLVVWDGEQERRGDESAEVIRYALSVGKGVVQINPVTRKAITLAEPPDPSAPLKVYLQERSVEG